MVDDHDLALDCWSRVLALSLFSSRVMVDAFSAAAGAG